MQQNLYGYNSMIPLTVGPGGLGPGGLGPGGLGPGGLDPQDCYKSVKKTSDLQKCLTDWQTCCQKSCSVKGKMDDTCLKTCMNKGEPHCTSSGPVVPKGNCGDCTGKDLGCCPEQARTCPKGCEGVGGCHQEEMGGPCVHKSEPNPIDKKGGCYIKDSEDCIFNSPVKCSDPINKKLCENDSCYNDSECKDPYSPKSPSHSPTPCGNIPSSWKSPEGKAFYECFIREYEKMPPPANVSKEDNDKLIKCMLAYAINNNISPADFLSSNFDGDTVAKNCV